MADAPAVAGRRAGCFRPSPEARLFSANKVMSGSDIRRRSSFGEAPLPAELDFSGRMLPVRDQGDTLHCVAYSICAVKELHDAFTKEEPRLDPGSIYALRADPSEDVGMAVLDGLAIAKHQGIAPEPHLHKIAGFAGAGLKTEDLKRALFQYGPCVVALPFAQPRRKGAHPCAFWDGKDEGAGHCVVFAGYSDGRKAFLLRNSWGSVWGVGGYTWFGYDDVEQFVWEAYSLFSGSAAPPRSLPASPAVPPSLP